MVTGQKVGLLNFFGIKESRKHILICIRCGSDNISRKQNLIECRECGKVLSIPAISQDKVA